MSDIVERLEKWGTGSPELILMLREASREIVKLRCEVAYWREPDDSATTIATIREATIEECAKVADTWAIQRKKPREANVAAAIRALASSPAAEEKK